MGIAVLEMKQGSIEYSLGMSVLQTWPTAAPLNCRYLSVSVKFRQVRLWKTIHQWLAKQIGKDGEN